MGKVIVDFTAELLKPLVYIKRRVDDIKTEEMRFTLSDDCRLITEGGGSIELTGKDRHHNFIKVDIPISVSELKKILDKKEIW